MGEVRDGREWFLAVPSPPVVPLHSRGRRAHFYRRGRYGMVDFRL